MAASEIKQETVKISDLPRRKAEGFVSVYANNAGSAMSFHDLRLIFGQMIFGPDEASVIEDRVSVTMPWEHALALRDLLARVIERYEKDNGKIRVEPHVEVPS